MSVAAGPARQHPVRGHRPGLRVAVSVGHPTLGPAGPRRYANALVGALSQRRSDVEVDVVPLVAPVHGAAARRAWDLLGAPLAARRVGADLLHCLGIYPPLPLPGGIPAVLTVHDLAVRWVPRTFPPVNRTLGWSLWSRLARRADAFVAVSASTGRDLVDLLGVEPGRVHVVPHGVAPVFHPRPRDEVAAARQKYALVEKYFLAVGTVEPRKNLAAVVAALDPVRRTRPEVGLAIVGAPGWGTRPLVDRLRSGAASSGARYLGRVPDADLAALYSGALALVYPSLFEGFGLPVLEAMACGCPVVTSARGGLAELARDAAVCVDPLAVADIAAAMARIADDEVLRRQLRRRGRDRAARYTWQSAADGTLAVYRQAAAMALAGGRR